MGTGVIQLISDHHSQLGSQTPDPRSYPKKSGLEQP
jgi:hypothetical protein